MNLEGTSPIFVLGRQHSGNTLLAAVFDRLPGVRGMKGEGTFFECWAELDRLQADERLSRLVDILGRSDAPHLSPEARGELEAALRAHRARGSDLSACALYVAGMEHLAGRRGKHRWAQKATSYIFYVDLILRAFPRAKLIYLLRNPLDLAASLKLRGGRHALLRMVYAWNKGARLAGHYQTRHPESFLVVRFEDLVGAPEPTVRRVLGFCGLDFHPDCLQVPLVNPAEEPYRMESAEQGMDASRLFRYRQVLTAAEEAVVRWGVSRQLIERHYPELRAPDRRVGLRLVPGAVWLVGRSAAALVAEHLGQLFSDPGHMVKRLRRRLT